MFNFISNLFKTNNVKVAELLKVSQEVADKLISHSSRMLAILSEVSIEELNIFDAIKDDLGTLQTINNLAINQKITVKQLETVIIKWFNIQYIITNPPLLDGKLFETKVINMLRGLNLYNNLEVISYKDLILSEVANRGIDVIAEPDIHFEALVEEARVANIKIKELTEQCNTLKFENDTLKLEIESKESEVSIPAKEISLTKRIKMAEKELENMKKQLVKEEAAAAKAAEKLAKDKIKAAEKKEKEKIKLAKEKEKMKINKAKAAKTKTITEENNGEQVIKPGRRTLTPKEKEKICKLYEKNNKMAKIAETIGVTNATVRNVLIAANLFTPTPREKVTE